MENQLIIDYTNIDVNLAKIQVMASIIKDMIKGKFVLCSKDIFKDYIPLPKGYENWESLNEYCKEQSKVDKFIIKSNIISECIYSCNAENILPDHIIYLRLAILQNTFDKLKNIKFDNIEKEQINELTKSLVYSYMCLNNDIGTYLLNRFEDCLDYFKPCIIDLDRMRDLNGFGEFIAYEINDKNRQIFETIYKVRMQEIACQCRFLSFWTCLLQIISCPSLPFSISQSFRNLAFCLLKNCNDIYVHYVILEQSFLNTKIDLSTRGSKDNTTRIKVYFTFKDGKPMIARFDLPHKGVPFLHINLEDLNGKCSKFDHCKLSIKSYENNILIPFEESLTTFNYSTIKHEHLTPDIDKRILQQVKLERALFGVSSNVWGQLLQKFFYKNDKENNNNNAFKKHVHYSESVSNYINECSEVLKKEILLNGINPDEFDTSEMLHLLVSF